MPFEGGIDSLSNGTLLLSAGAAMLYLMMRGQPPSLRRSVVKTAAVALLALLAIIEGGPLLLVLALALSAAGDGLLAQEGETTFLAGLASFLLAHLVFVALFVLGGGGAAMILDDAWRLVLAAGFLAFGAVMAATLLPRVGTALRLPVAAYAVAIVAMGIAAATTPSMLVIVGALLFIASDALLATERFLLPGGAPQRALTGPAVWILYYVAQLCFVFAFIV